MQVGPRLRSFSFIPNSGGQRVVAVVVLIEKAHSSPYPVSATYQALSGPQPRSGGQVSYFVIIDNHNISWKAITLDPRKQDMSFGQD